MTIEPTCPHCEEPIESTGTGWWRHVYQLHGPCGVRLMDAETAFGHLPEFWEEEQ